MRLLPEVMGFLDEVVIPEGQGRYTFQAVSHDGGQTPTLLRDLKEYYSVAQEVASGFEPRQNTLTD
jgi:hypothetical protein